VPDETRVLWRTAQAYVHAFESFDKNAVAAAGEELAVLARTIIEDRRARPRDPDADPTSSLLVARDADGRPLPDDLLAGCVRQVLVVGLVAPPIVTGAMTVHLADDVLLQARLREDPMLVKSAVEEFLRLYTPYRGFARTSREAVTFGGRTICPGEPIALNYASANRDEAVFEKPDEFQLNRPNIGQHLAFGRGPHRCAGMPLARLEMTIALETLVTLTSSIEVTGPIRMSRMPELGPTSVPVRVVRR
jgi:cytochrome P450